MTDEQKKVNRAQAEIVSALVLRLGIKQANYQDGNVVELLYKGYVVRIEMK